MPLRYLEPSNTQYIPQYTPIDPKMLYRTADIFNQQAEQSNARRHETYAAFRENVDSMTGLSEEQRNELNNLFSETQASIDEYYEQHGARGAGNFLNTATRKFTEQAKPFQERNLQIKNYSERIQQSENAPAEIRSQIMSRLQRINNETSLSERLNLENEVLTLESWRDITDEIIKIDKLMKDGSMDIGITNVPTDQQLEALGLQTLSGRSFENVNEIYMAYVLRNSQMRNQFLLQAEILAENENNLKEFRDENGELSLEKTNEYLHPDGRKRNYNVIQYLAADAIEPLAMARENQTIRYNISNLTGGQASQADKPVIHGNWSSLRGADEGSEYKSINEYLSSLADLENELGESIDGTIRNIKGILGVNAEELTTGNSSQYSALFDEVQESDGRTNLVINQKYYEDYVSRLNESTQNNLNNQLEQLNGYILQRENARFDRQSVSQEAVEQYQRNNLDLNSFGLKAYLDDDGEFKITTTDEDENLDKSLLRHHFHQNGERVVEQDVIEQARIDSERLNYRYWRDVPDEIKEEFRQKFREQMMEQGVHPNHNMLLDRNIDGMAGTTQGARGLFFDARDSAKNMMNFEQIEPGETKIINAGRYNDVFYRDPVNNKLYRIQGSFSSSPSQIIDVRSKSANIRSLSNQIVRSITQEFEQIVKERTQRPPRQVAVFHWNKDNLETKAFLENITIPHLANFGEVIDTETGKIIDRDNFDGVNPSRSSLTSSGMSIFDANGNPVMYLDYYHPEEEKWIQLEYRGNALNEFVNQNFSNDIANKMARNYMISHVGRGEDINRTTSSFNFSPDRLVSIIGSDAKDSKINNVELVRRNSNGTIHYDFIISGQNLSHNDVTIKGNTTITTTNYEDGFQQMLIELRNRANLANLIKQ